MNKMESATLIAMIIGAIGMIAGVYGAVAGQEFSTYFFSLFIGLSLSGSAYFHRKSISTEKALVRVRVKSKRNQF